MFFFQVEFNSVAFSKSALKIAKRDGKNQGFNADTHVCVITHVF